jgi:hypothetical protein
MMFNVWGIIWPNNKRIICGTLAGTPPANAAALARQVFPALRTNFFLSVPLLFYMAASVHSASTWYLESSASLKGRGFSPPNHVLLVCLAFHFRKYFPHGVGPCS